MNNYQSITASPEALALLVLRAADCDDCRRPERDSPLWWLGLPAAEAEK